MRRKLAAAAGAVLVLALAVVGFVLFSGDDKSQKVALTIPQPSDDSPVAEPPRASTKYSFIPSPAEPPPATTSTTTTTSTPPTVPSPPPNPPPGPAGQTVSGKITFYGARNNQPSGSRAIAHPNALHRQAGGTGTFEDPITFAAGSTYRPGTRIYVPELKRYFVMEDLCPQCSGTQVNLWAGAATDSGSVDCQKSLTRDGTRPYEVNPPPGRQVVAGDLYQNGRCFRP